MIRCPGTLRRFNKHEFALRGVTGTNECIGKRQKALRDDILFAVVTELGVRVKYPLPPLQLGLLHGNRALDSRDCRGEFLVVRCWWPVRTIVAMHRREEAG